MSRSGYSDYCEGPELAMYRGQVASAIRGKRGQAFLRELLEALDAMPERRLIAGELRNDSGVCALGCVGAKRGLPLEEYDPENREHLGRVFGIAWQLVAELEYENDDHDYFWSKKTTPEVRWQRVRDWVVANIREVRP